MDLSKFTTNDKKETLLLAIAKSNLDIVDNTRSQPQETLEFKMNKHQKSFPFDPPLQLPDKWMMGVISLEVYNSVFNVTERNNSFKVELDSDLVYTKKIQPLITVIEQQFSSPVPKTEFMKLMREKSKGIKLYKSEYKALTKVLKNLKKVRPNSDITEDDIDSLEFLDEEEKEYCTITLNPGVYELDELNVAIQQQVNTHNKAYQKILPTAREIKIDITADTISMRSILTTTHPICFNNNFKNLLGFVERDYPEGTHRSEKPIMISTVDKIHLKCDCVDGSIVNGLRQSILYSFSLDKPPGYKITKEPNTILYKKVNKETLDRITFYLEDDDHQPVDFNGETLTFTIQLIKI